MNIAFVIHELAPFRQHFIRQLLDRMPGVSVTIYLTLPDAGFDWERRIPPSVCIVPLGHGHTRFTQGRPRAWIRELFKGRSLLRHLSSSLPTVLFVGGYADVAHRMALRWANSHGVQSLLWIDSNARGDKARGARLAIKKIMLRRVFHEATGILVCGSLGREYALKYGAEPGRIALCPAIPDTKALRRAIPSMRPGLFEGRRRFLYVGRLADEKRVDLLIDAFGMIARNRPEWDLVIVGAGPLEQDLHQRVRMDLRDRVHWLGAINVEQDIANIYRACDVFVLPSQFEPWGVVVVEAALAGLALVCSDVVGAAADLLVQDRNGALFLSRSSSALANAMALVSASNHIDAFKKHSMEVSREWLTAQKDITELPVFSELARKAALPAGNDGPDQ